MHYIWIFGSLTSVFGLSSQEVLFGFFICAPSTGSRILYPIDGGGDGTEKHFTFSLLQTHHCSNFILSEV